MLDPVLLRSFLTLAAELHFGRAAQRLNMTQPPLSRQILKLEDHLGTRLFERTSHAVALTAAGRALRPEAEAVLRRLDEAEQSVRRLSASPSGEVRLGFIAAACFDLLPRLVRRAAADYPNLTLTLTEMDSDAQLDTLALGGIDMGLARPVAVPPALAAETVSREPLLVALPLQNPLAQRQRLGLSDIAAEPFVAYDSHALYMHILVEGLMRRAGIAPPIVQRLSHAQAILSLVAVGMGVSIVPSSARRLGFDNLVFRPLRGPEPALQPEPQAETVALWRRDTRNRAVALVGRLSRELGAEPAA